MKVKIFHLTCFFFEVIKRYFLKITNKSIRHEVSLYDWRWETHRDTRSGILSRTVHNTDTTHSGLEIDNAVRGHNVPSVTTFLVWILPNRRCMSVRELRVHPLALFLLSTRLWRVKEGASSVQIEVQIEVTKEKRKRKKNSVPERDNGSDLTPPR